MVAPSFSYVLILACFGIKVHPASSNNDADDIQLIQKHIDIDSSLERHAKHQDPGGAQDDDYAYPVVDAYSCKMMFPHHQEQLSAADLTSQFADDGELPLWRAMQAYFSALPTRGKYLDVGCGQGRIVGFFSGLFEDVTCLEPDSERLNFARTTHEQWGRTQNINFVNDILSNLNSTENSFDAISFIHVAQHIPDVILKGMLADIHRLLKPDGVLIFASTQASSDRFGLSNGTNGLSIDQFNVAAGHPTGGVLAVRMFSPPTFSAYVQEAGFTQWTSGLTSWMGDGPDGPLSQFVVVGKGNALQPNPAPSNVPLASIFCPVHKKLNRIQQRRSCFTVCPGKAGETPADFLCNGKKMSNGV